MKSYKDDFPIFKEYPDMIYLDSAATCQKPQRVIDSFATFYSKYNANIGRGSYPLADLAQQKYNESKKTVADFFSTKSSNVIFTYGATDSLNQSAFMLSQLIHQHPNKKTLIISLAEHHSNLLPWIRLAKDCHLNIHFCNAQETVNPNLIADDIKNNALAFIFTHVSNVTGEILPASSWINTAKTYGAYSIVDGSQAVGSFRVNFDKLLADFYSFSSHKMYGPMGVGALLVSDRVLKQNVEPLRLGGGIVDDVDTFIYKNRMILDSYSLIDGNEKYETGTPNLANIYAMAEGIRWMLDDSQWYNAVTYMNRLSSYMYKSLEKNGIQRLRIDNTLEQTHIASFVLSDIHSHDVGSFLHTKNIAVRTGKHCAYPLYEGLNINSSTRISIGLYNTTADIDKLIEAVKSAQDFFKKV